MLLNILGCVLFKVKDEIYKAFENIYHVLTNLE